MANNQWIKLPNRNTVIAITIILITTIFDALRDGNYGNSNWWCYHIPKWVAFYGPLAFIAMEHLRIQTIAIVAAVSWVLWSAALTITPAPWDGSFIRVVKWLLEVLV